MEWTPAPGIDSQKVKTQFTDWIVTVGGDWKCIEVCDCGSIWILNDISRLTVRYANHSPKISTW